MPTPTLRLVAAMLGEAQVVGLLVSAVCDILAVTDAAIQPIPDAASGPARACLHGLLTVEDRMVGLLRTDQLVPEGARAATPELEAA